MTVPDFRIDGRRALITGAAAGIGLAIARALAVYGAAVAIQDINLEAAKSQVKLLTDAGFTAMAIGGDVTDLREVDRIADDAVRGIGGIDILVNNAAIQIHHHWQQNSREEIDRQFQADLLFPLLLCQKLVGPMRSRKWGRILNIGSIQQFKGNPDMLPYSTSKAALAHMTIALARDLAPDRITVNQLAPGYFDTLRNKGDFPDEQTKITRGQRIVPVGRIGESNDCAGIALLLCSNAGEYITGQSIAVDGGLNCR